MGVKVAISSDAHNLNHLNYMQYGIYQARRGWLEAKDVLNTYSLPAFKKLIQR
jgi:DNA polymerase (family 10)